MAVVLLACVAVGVVAQITGLVPAIADMTGLN